MLGHMNSTLVAKERRDASLNRGSDLLLDLWRHDTLADLGKKAVSYTHLTLPTKA